MDKSSSTSKPGKRTRMPRIEPFVFVTIIGRAPDFLQEALRKEGLMLDEDGEFLLESRLPLRALFDLLTSPATKQKSPEDWSSEPDSKSSGDSSESSEDGPEFGDGEGKVTKKRKRDVMDITD